MSSASSNPYPGLRAFDGKFIPYFFGRGRVVAQLVERIGSNHFVAVVGPSGSGKSSLVEAGLIPALYAGQVAQPGTEWRVAAIRPTPNPVAALAAELNKPSVLGFSTNRFEVLETSTLFGLLEATKEGRSERRSLLVFVDRFEDVFRLVSERKLTADAANHFISLLLSTVSHPRPSLPVYVVITLRSEYLSLPAQDIDWSTFDRGAEHVRGLRIGLLLEAGCGLAVEPEIRSAIENAARLFERAGAQVTLMKPFMTQAMLDGIDHFFRMRSHVDFQALPAQRKALILPYIQEWAQSAAGMSGAEVFKAYSQFHLTRVASVKACNAFDYVISPTAPVSAFPAEYASPTNDPLRPLEHIGFTVPYNMSEQPAASINCGYTAAGLPIGLQIAGRRFDDLGVLRVSRAFELLRGEQRAWPQPPSEAVHHVD